MLTTIYLTLAIILTTSIYLKTHKISTLSKHPGINLLNKSFLFFALYYIIQFLTSTSTLNISKQAILQALTLPVQTYLITIAALYLSASLFWKNQNKDKSPLHIIALLVTVLNNINPILTPVLITIYAITTIQAYTNYSIKKNTFSEFYLIAITLLFLSSLSSFFHTPFSSQAMTLTAFSIFLYGTLKTIKN